MAERKNQGPNNGGSARNPIPGPVQRLREGVGEVGERMHEGYDAAREGVSRGYRRAEGMVARNPGTSVMVGFGVGVGVGVLLAMILTERERPWYDRYVPEGLRHLPDRFRRIPEAVAEHWPGH